MYSELSEKINLKFNSDEANQVFAAARSYAMQQAATVPRNPSWQTEKQWRTKMDKRFDTCYAEYLKKELSSGRTLN